jgi:DNA-binding transcriptional ArsR family regulator
VVREARAALAREAFTEGSFAAGYAAALADVAASFDAVRGSDDDEQAAVEIIKRGSVRDVLTALRDGVVAPGDIARRLGKRPEVVTRLLGDLREAHLAEEADVEGGDRRRNPHRLTERGLAITERLAPTLPEQARLGIAFASRVLGVLAQRGSSPLDTLVKIGEIVFGSLDVGRAAAEAFLEAAKVAAIATVGETGVRLSPSYAGARSQLEALLRDATERQETPLLAHVETLGSAPMYLVICSMDLKTPWRTLLAGRSKVYGQFRVFDSLDFDMPAIEAHDQICFLYDDVQTFLLHGKDARFARLHARASKCICITTGQDDVPAGVERLPLSQLAS